MLELELIITDLNNFNKLIKPSHILIEPSINTGPMQGYRYLGRYSRYLGSWVSYFTQVRRYGGRSGI